jgi:hypothetical protein
VWGLSPDTTHSPLYITARGWRRYGQGQRTNLAHDGNNLKCPGVCVASRVQMSMGEQPRFARMQNKSWANRALVTVVESVHCPGMCDCDMLLEGLRRVCDVCVHVCVAQCAFVGLSVSP